MSLSLRIENVQRLVYETIAEPPEGYRVGEIFNSCILTLIAVNVTVGVFETVPTLYAKHDDFFYYFEMISVYIFSAEYLLTLWSCTVDERFQQAGCLMGRIKAATRVMSIIDVLAIAPFYLSEVYDLDLRFVRILRLFRLFRLFRQGKLAESFRILKDVIVSRKNHLVSGFLVIGLNVLLSSSVMYIIEQDVPGTKFTSIPASMWWGVVTVTTIGYGRMTPESTLGKVFGSLVALSAILVFALPVGIIAAGFAEHMDEELPDNKPKENNNDNENENDKDNNKDKDNTTQPQRLENMQSGIANEQTTTADVESNSEVALSISIPKSKRSSQQHNTNNNDVCLHCGRSD